MTHSPKHRDRQVPVPLLHYVEVTQMVGFTWKQRLKLLLGFKVLLHAFLHTQHAPGRFKPTFKVTLTPHDKLARAFEDTKTQVFVAQGEPWPVDIVDPTRAEPDVEAAPARPPVGK